MDENRDLLSDNMSHLSMEVNTTGTGSIKGDLEFEDFAMDGDVEAIPDEELDALLS